MSTTPHLGMTLLESSQAQKEVTMNEALNRLDVLHNSGAMDKDLATPPATPAEGDVYIVAASATGDWTGKDGQIAYFEQIWRFITPREGALLWVNDEDKLYAYDGAAWIAASGGTDMIYEAGTFTPRFGAISPSYTSQTGRYTRIGNMVYAEIDLDISSLSTSDTDENNLTDLAYNIGNAGFILGEIDVEASTLLSVSSGNNLRIGCFPTSTSIIQIKNESGDAYRYNSGLFNSSGKLKLALQYRI